MEKNIQEVATENAQIQDLQNQVVELKYQLDVAKWLNEMHKSVLTEGKFEVKNGVELYRSLFAIGKTQEAKDRSVINYLEEYFEGGCEVYFTFTDKWLVNMKQEGGEVMFWLPECL